ncbi:MAG: class-II fumarase/aspartase family protein [Candidatus Dormibacteria bacterium]
MGAIFSAERTAEYWLVAERALGRAQAEVGIITEAEAADIERAATLDSVELERLWQQTRVVGYPILPLVRTIASHLPNGRDGRVHYGATTQDIMDTGLALQLLGALHRLGGLIAQFGDELARLVLQHQHTVMAGRTHGQQAVPTTFGVKLAVYLDELTRHVERLNQIHQRVGRVSLYGAAGTTASLGRHGDAVRVAMAKYLGLTASNVPWHVARDSIAEFGLNCGMLAATAARFAREVIELSRTEIREVAERNGHLRGASSTMPQKANPISSEVVVGMAGVAGALASALYQAMAPTHERGAGEWQMEWYAVPQLAELAAGALLNVGDVAAGLQVFPETMAANLLADGGLVLSEAYMMRLADVLGREAAHELVYEAAGQARVHGEPLLEVLNRLAPLAARAVLDEMGAGLAAESYLGDPASICQSALAAWAGRDRGYMLRLPLVPERTVAVAQSGVPQ